MDEKQTIIGTIIGTITTAFSKFVGVVKRNGVAISTYCTLLLIIIYSIIINPINLEHIIETLQKNDIKEHSKSIDKRLLADQLVPPILENIRLKYGLDRVCLMEMHNSTESINRVSFLYMSLVYEQYDFTNDSIMSVSDSYQQQRTSEYYEIFSEIAKQGYLYIGNIKNYNGSVASRLTKKLIHNGSNSIFIIPLTKNNRIDAMLVMTSRKPSIDIKTIGSHIFIDVEKLKTLIF